MIIAGIENNRVVRAPRMARRIRRPVHNAYIHFLPHVIQPIYAAPVVPGETLKNMLIQGRIISTPVRNQVSGWWLETYHFYVKHRHMANSATYTAMMLDLNASTTPAEWSGTEVQFNGVAGDMQFFRDAYIAVVNEYFRGDGEVWNTPGTTWGGLSLARLKLPGWWDSIIPDSALVDAAAGIGSQPVTDPAYNQIGEIGRALETWQQLRMLNLTNLEYDDWLRSFGVQIAAPVDDRPELVRYTREWQYPANSVSVDATAQRVSSVLSWSVMERADKDRFFREPGVLLGVCIARPKLYHDRQATFLGQMGSAVHWQTPFNSIDRYARYRPVRGLAGHSLDPADGFNHGDQYRYLARGTLTGSVVAWPADGSFAYPTPAEIDACFVDGSAGFLRSDWSVNFAIATAAVGADSTPTTI